MMMVQKKGSDVTCHMMKLRYSERAITLWMSRIACHAFMLIAPPPSVFPAPANLHTFRCLAYTALAGQCSVPVYGRPYFANASLDLYPASIHFSHPGPFSRLHKFSIVSSPGSHPSPSHQHDFPDILCAAHRPNHSRFAFQQRYLTKIRVFFSTDRFFFFPLFRPHGAYSAW